MKELSAIKSTEQKSRFFAHLYSIESEAEIEEILKSHRREYKKACHHCYAFLVAAGSTGGISGAGRGTYEGFKDDGEVGHPGKVLLEILKKHNLASHALVVSRVFGGAKLGVGGVSRAFRDAGEAAISAVRQDP